ncbi:hypothetical protein [Novosphingobium sp. Leaf2]|uniref:hypothetical protein n=1 Tax=Novosphingobium sp. Leaf2 TaxID=1735670 RepID=UPI0006F4C3F1|nr:hypothetical protein [Novosphingobium sp. Leaf2]KQM21896.1 hypothetical protein ASE49_00850 [Novosphingobium sp. Leaf2]
MRNLTPAEKTRLREALMGNGLLLLFGCLVLAFLVSVDRMNWFAIRPATGTSIAMARSTEAGDTNVKPQKAVATLAQRPRTEPASHQ